MKTKNPTPDTKFTPGTSRIYVTSSFSGEGCIHWSKRGGGRVTELVPEVGMGLDVRLQSLTNRGI